MFALSQQQSRTPQIEIQYTENAPMAKRKPLMKSANFKNTTHYTDDTLNEMTKNTTHYIDDTLNSNDIT